MVPFYTSTTSTGYIWNEWASTASTTTATTEIYTKWISESLTITTNVISGYIYAQWVEEHETALQVRHETEQQRIRRLAEQERERQHYQQQRMLREVAENKANQAAKQLLVSALNKTQRMEYIKEGFFFVMSPSGALYRIREGRSINIDLMKGNSRTEVHKRLCAHPKIACPNGDTMLTQKIMLEHQEKDFLRIARTYEPLH